MINTMYFTDSLYAMRVFKACKHKNDSIDFDAMDFYKESILFNIELESGVTDEKKDKLSKLINEKVMSHINELRSFVDQYNSNRIPSFSELNLYSKRLLKSIESISDIYFSIILNQKLYLACINIFLIII